MPLPKVELAFPKVGKSTWPQAGQHPSQNRTVIAGPQTARFFRLPQTSAFSSIRSPRLFGLRLHFQTLGLKVTPEQTGASDQNVN
jgi:hypothetical protein